MGDSYVECLVERDRNMQYFALKMVMYVLCGIFILLALFVGVTLFFIIGVALGVIGAFAIPNPDYEFEYLLVNKEFSVDRIIAKSKRKTVINLDLNKMEFMCPNNSHELDSYKNKKTPVQDFGSGRDGVKTYVIVYHDEKGDQLVLIEPSAELMKAIKNVFPRKVIEY